MMSGQVGIQNAEGSHHEARSTAIYANADAELADESIGLWTQLVRFLLGSNDADQPQEPLRWRLAAAANGVCAVAKRGSSGVSVCFAAAGGHARVIDVQVDALSSVDECVWNREGDLLACCCHRSASLVVLRVDVATQSVPSAGQLVDLGPDRGLVATVHFRSSAELVVVSTTACILRVAVSGEPDVRPPPPAYFVSKPGEAASLSRTLRIAGGAVQRAALWRHAPAAEFFWSKGGDVLTLASDDRLYMIGLLDHEPYFERIRDLPVRAPGEAPPAMAVGFLTPLGTSRLVRRDRVVHMALSPNGRYLATLTRGGHLLVRYSGLEFNPRAPTDLGNAVVARTAPEDDAVLDAVWWDNDHLLITRKDASQASRAKLALVPLEDPLSGDSMLVSSVDSALSRPLSLSSSSSSDRASALAFALSCDKQWLSKGDQRPPNATIAVDGHFLLRHYRLSALVSRSPQELYEHHLARKDFAQAEELATTFALDLDLLAKARWEHAPVRSVEAIHELLGAVRDLDWVLDCCVNQLPHTEAATRALLAHGLERCANTDLSASQRDMENELGALKKRLDVFMSIRGDEGFDAVEFSIFRTRDLSRQAHEAAEDGEAMTVNLLVKAYPEVLGPVMLSVLSCFPETTSPMLYADLLPACADTSEGREIDEPAYYVLLSGESVPLYSGEGAPDLPAVLAWYQHRIVEIDQASGMLDLALELGQCALVRLDSCASDPAAQELFSLIDAARELNRLVYQAGLRDSIALEAWVRMDDYDRLCVALDGSRSATIVKAMSVRVLPWYRDLEPPSLIVWLGHIRRYLRARARGLDEPREMPAAGSASLEGLVYDMDEARDGIELCAEVIHQSRPLAVSEGGVDRRERLIPLPTALIETALACCYACPAPDAQSSFDKIFQSLPARQREMETRVPALAALQDRVEMLDTFLDVNAQLAPFHAAVPLQVFADSYQANETQEAEHLLESGLVQREEALLEHLMTGSSTHWFESDARSEFVASPDPTDLASVATGEGANARAERPVVDPGYRIALRVLRRAAATPDAGREHWDRALAAVWSLRRALPYLSRRFLARGCLLTLLRAGQFDVAHELIVDMDEAAGENAILLRDEMEDLVIEVSQEFFNSSADFGSDEMKKAQNVLKTLPFAASQRVQTEANLVQILDLLSNQLGTPMVPLQVRMFINSDAPEEIVDRVLNANPLLYKNDSKLLRLAYLMGLEGPDQSAAIRLRVVQAALAHDDIETARRLVDAMVEKAEVLLDSAAATATFSTDTSPTLSSQVARTAEVSAHACLALAESLIASTPLEGRKEALRALELASNGETSVQALRLVSRADGHDEDTSDQEKLPWKSVWLEAGIRTFRQMRRSCPAEWAVAELAHDPLTASIALGELLREDASRAGQVESCLDSLQEAMGETLEASSSKQSQVIYGALRGLAVRSASAGKVSATLCAAPSRLVQLVQAGVADCDVGLQGLAMRLCEDCKALADSHSLLRLLPNVNVSLFQKDPAYRKRALMDAARAFGHESVPYDGEEWQALSVLAESSGGATAWDLDAARVTGVVLSGSSIKDIETQLRKDTGVTRVLAEPLAARKVLRSLWHGIPGKQMDQLALVENLMLRSFDEADHEGDNGETATCKQRLKDRRNFYKRLEKLSSTQLDVKRLVGAPLDATGTLDRDSALEEITFIMNKKNVKRVAKLMSTSVECEPPLRPSEIVLHYCSHLLGLLKKEEGDDVRDSGGILTEVSAPAARAGRQTYKSSCADLVKILVPGDAAVLARLCASRGGRRDLLDLDLREKIVDDCAASMEESFTRKGPSDDAEEIRAALGEARGFLSTLRFLTETLDLDRQPSVTFVNDLEQSDLHDAYILTAFQNAVLSGAFSSDVLVRACGHLGKSPVSMFEEITSRVLDGSSEHDAMDYIPALVSFTSYLVAFEEETSTFGERATGDAMLSLLRNFAATAKSEEIRINLLKLLSIAGLDQAGDQALLQNLKALRAVQEIWPEHDISIEQVKGTEQRLDLISSLGTPVGLSERRHLERLLLEWDELTDCELVLADEIRSCDLHARNLAHGLVSSYLDSTDFGKLDCANEVSRYAPVWDGLAHAAAREGDDPALLHSVRYNAGSAVLMTEATEMHIFEKTRDVKFGLYSAYANVRSAAKAILMEDERDFIIEPTTAFLILASCALPSLSDPILDPVLHHALAAAAYTQGKSAPPFTWSPTYLALALCFRDEYTRAGDLALVFGCVPKVLRTGSAWHMAVRQVIMQASLSDTQEGGWELAAEFASAVQARFNETCCVDRSQESKFSVSAFRGAKVTEIGRSSTGDQADEDDWNNSWDEENDGAVDTSPAANDSGGKTNNAEDEFTSERLATAALEPPSVAPGGWSDEEMDIDVDAEADETAPDSRPHVSDVAPDVGEGVAWEEDDSLEDGDGIQEGLQNSSIDLNTKPQSSENGWEDMGADDLSLDEELAGDISQDKDREVVEGADVSQTNKQEEDQWSSGWPEEELEDANALEANDAAQATKGAEPVSQVVAANGAREASGDDYATTRSSSCGLGPGEVKGEEMTAGWREGVLDRLTDSLQGTLNAAAAKQDRALGNESFSENSRSDGTASGWQDDDGELDEARIDGMTAEDVVDVHDDEKPKEVVTAGGGVTSKDNVRGTTEQSGWDDADDSLGEAHSEGNTTQNDDIDNDEMQDDRETASVMADQNNIGSAIDKVEQSGWNDSDNGLDDAQIDETTAEDVVDEDNDEEVDEDDAAADGLAGQDDREDVVEQSGWNDADDGLDEALDEAHIDGTTADDVVDEDDDEEDVVEQSGWNDADDGLDEVLDEALDEAHVDDTTAEDVADEEHDEMVDEDDAAAGVLAQGGDREDAAERTGWNDADDGLDEALDEAYLDGTTVDDVNNEDDRVQDTTSGWQDDDGDIGAADLEDKGDGESAAEHIAWHDADGGLDDALESEEQDQAASVEASEGNNITTDNGPDHGMFESTFNENKESHQRRAPSSAEEATEQSTSGWQTEDLDMDAPDSSGLASSSGEGAAQDEDGACSGPVQEEGVDAREDAARGRDEENGSVRNFGLSSVAEGGNETAGAPGEDSGWMQDGEIGMSEWEDEPIEDAAGAKTTESGIRQDASSETSAAARRSADAGGAMAEHARLHSDEGGEHVEATNRMPPSEDAIEEEGFSGVYGEATSGVRILAPLAYAMDGAESHLTDASGSTIGNLARALEHMDLGADNQSESSPRAFIGGDVDAAERGASAHVEELAGEETGGEAPPVVDAESQSMSEAAEETSEQRSSLTQPDTVEEGDGERAREGSDSRSPTNSTEDETLALDASQSAGVDALAEPHTTPAAGERADSGSSNPPRSAWGTPRSGALGSPTPAPRAGGSTGEVTATDAPFDRGPESGAGETSAGGSSPKLTTVRSSGSDAWGLQDDLDLDLDEGPPGPDEGDHHDNDVGMNIDNNDGNADAPWPVPPTEENTDAQAVRSRARRTRSGQAPFDTAPARTAATLDAGPSAAEEDPGDGAASGAASGAAAALAGVDPPAQSAGDVAPGGLDSGWDIDDDLDLDL
ncbi:Neuroblastoma-amplified sequence [Hondaea fermentalgiana]|uniref:Neuroblastoma-amplified sequence n=1 Tax=Hondaea fermentalgiana TaxID=2315210 RepID=A0A2R5G2U2_9STRA|nr:Neuroblastoma-amplified sequence [Hondaea fermentalgiana]|eukprot:GBG25347.1 Neuroblastoma-amplified sequence [Hondaea fermentalgiana]